MRLVMGGESLVGQLTGTGQYTLNLVEALRLLPSIEDVKLQAHGVLLEPDRLLANHVAMNSRRRYFVPSPSRKIQMLGKARSIAAQSGVATGIYERLMPHLERRSFRHYGSNDVYHSPNYMLPIFPGKRVVSILDLSTYRFPEHHPHARVRFVNSHIQQALRHADHIITISNVVKNEIMERFKYPEHKITVTHLAASNAFKPLTEAQFQAETHMMDVSYKNYFLFASTIEPRKNLERLLDAYASYSTESPNSPLPLLVVGAAGWKSQRTCERLKRLAAKGDVRYLGRVSQNLLPALIAGARALLYPSLYEGFGLPVVEAMQSGTAVMTSRGTAMAEIGGSTVIQVDPYSDHAMAGALLRMEQDDLAISRLEKNGLDVAQQFSWQRCAQETLSAYDAAGAEH